MKPQRIYLDNAATTPLDKNIARIMRDFELEFFGNPSSIHKEGQEARAKIDFARASIAQFFNCKPQEIIFTSSATESNNHAIQGVISHCLKQFPIKPHVITTMLEHHSVYNTVKELEARQVIEATFIKPDKEGIVQAEQIIREIKENTVLVSIIFVSNEIGVVLPIREIGKLITEQNKLNTRQHIVFHTDAVQAVKFYNCNVEKLGIDLMTFSAHKINGPKGIGGLYVKKGTHLENLMFGGAQEYEMRPGTQNTAGIIGMTQAYEQLGTLDDRIENVKIIRELKHSFINALNDSRISINGTHDPELSAPDIINFSIEGIDQEMAIAKLDLAGIAASTGSACVSGSTQPSHVIQALGKFSDKESATIRISIGKQNTMAEINKAVEQIKLL